MANTRWLGGLLAAALLLPFPALAQKAKVPKGKNMEQYMDSLKDDYLDDWLEKAEEREEKLKQKAESKDGFTKDENPIERGAPGEFVDVPGVNGGPKSKMILPYDMTDIMKMFSEYYSGCGSPQMVGLCIKPSLFKIELAPYWEYYVPFQKVEAVMEPFNTAYYPRTRNKEKMKLSEEAFYETGNKASQGRNAERALKMDELQTLRQRAEANQWEIKAPEDKDNTIGKSIKKVKQDFKEEQRFRNPVYSTGGTTYSEYHVVPTHFDRYWRNFRMFNTIEFNRWIPLTWCHRGAKHATSKTSTQKPEVPRWFSEWPQGILLSRFHSLSYLHDGFKKELFEKAAIDNCRKRHYDAHTPKDAIPDGTKWKSKVDGKDDEKKCLQEMNDGRGFMTIDTMTNYPTQAAQVSVYRGIRVAREMQKKNIYEQDEGKDKKFHRMLYQDKGNVKRDKFQWLNPMSGERKMPKGCGPFKSEKKFIPGWWGPEYGDGNKNWTKYGNWFSAAQWTYNRCCPRGYFLLAGPRPEIYDTQLKEDDYIGGS